MSSRELGLKLQYYRKLKNISVVELSNMSGISEHQIRRYESSTQDVPYSNLKHLCDVLNLKIIIKENKDGEQFTNF